MRIDFERQRRQHAAGRRLQPGSMLSPISGAGKKPEKVARKPARSAGRRKDGLRPAQSKLVQTSWP